MALDPSTLAAHTTLGEAYVMLERWQDAIDILGAAQRIWPRFALTTGMLAGALHRAGQASRAKELIRGLGSSPGPPTGVTLYHVISGDLDAAADWYTRSVELRDPFALVFANGPMAHALWQTPRWPRIAAMMNMPPKVV